jgi:arsenate reductase-like glutaredoxin family protein
VAEAQARGIERSTLERWCTKLGWETVLKRAGTTFRKLPRAHKHTIDGCLCCGFKPELFQRLFRLPAES